MADSKTSTLFATELAMRPAVRIVTLASCAIVAALLGWSFYRIPVAAWLACAVPALLLEASNLHYLRTHVNTTIGMIPVALFSLIPALVTVLLSSEASGLATFACQVALALLAILLAVFVWWAIRLRRTYSANPSVSPDAALIVLGGAIKHGRPCKTLVRRLDVAARLWHEDQQRIIVVTGGPTPDGSTTEADEMALYLRDAGVPAKRTLLERVARNTSENIQYSTELLDRVGHTGQRCIVSSDYHLWRATRDAHKLNQALVPIAAPTPRTSILQQWCREILTVLAGR